MRRMGFGRPAWQTLSTRLCGRRLVEIDPWPDCHSVNEIMDLFGLTSNLSYVLESPIPGTNYTSGVRAKDATGFENNTNFVLVSVPLPTFAGCSGSEAQNSSSTQVRFPYPAGASQVAVYRGSTAVFTVRCSAKIAPTPKDIAVFPPGGSRRPPTAREWCRATDRAFVQVRRDADGLPSVFLMCHQICE